MPIYPTAANGAAGDSRIRFTIDADGRVVRAVIVSPSGPSREHHRLDVAAVEALAKCPVLPGNDQYGRPVGGEADVPFKWRLDGPPNTTTFEVKDLSN